MTLVSPSQRGSLSLMLLAMLAMLVVLLLLLLLKLKPAKLGGGLRSSLFLVVAVSVIFPDIMSRVNLGTRIVNNRLFFFFLVLSLLGRS